MPIVRRVYLYTIALIALGMLVSGLDGLLTGAVLSLLLNLAPPTLVIIDLGEPAARVSLAAAFAIIGLATWLIHWIPAERLAGAPDEAGREERGSAIRRLFLYAALFVGGIILSLAFGHLIRDFILAATGRLSSSEWLTGGIVRPATTLVITGTFWLYYRGVAGRDRRLVPEVGAGATLRRWFLYGLSFFGLLIALFAAANLVMTLWEIALPRPNARIIGPEWSVPNLIERIGTFAAGVVTWALAWSAGTRALAQVGPDPEVRSVLRKVYLYLVLAITVAWTVWNGGQILYVLLRGALLPGDVPAGLTGVLALLGPPVARVLVFGLAWVYHARAVEREARLAAERRQQATIRWFYQYLAALVGLITVAVGIIGTLSTVIDLAIQPGATRPTDWWQNRISLFATLVVVGLPLWLAYWRRVQAEVGDPLARGSVIRRIYLFLAIGIGVVTILGSGAFSLYQGLRLALGGGWSAAQTSELIAALSTVAVVAVLLAYHIRVFRQDAARGIPAAPEPAGAAAAVAGDGPRLIEAVVRVPNESTWNDLYQAFLARAPSGVTIDVRSIRPAGDSEGDGQGRRE